MRYMIAMITLGAVMAVATPVALGGERSAYERYLSAPTPITQPSPIARSASDLTQPAGPTPDQPWWIRMRLQNMGH